LTLQKRLLLLSLFFAIFCSTCFAQEHASALEKPDAPAPKPELLLFAQSPESQTQSQPQSPPQQGQNPPAPQSDKPVPQDENPKRILEIVPNFQTTNQAPDYKPMTVREKYVLTYHQTVDFSVHFGNLFQAMLQQASNGQPHYGQGWGAYAQRFGAAEADQVTSAFFIFGFLPHVLREDPRYFRMGPAHRPLRRIAYAATRTVITKTDAGGSAFNTPQVLGQLAQQSISTYTYYPKTDRSVSGLFQNWGVNLSYNSAYNVLKEYYPDFLRWTFKRHPKQKEAPAAPAPTQPASPSPTSAN